MRKQSRLLVVLLLILSGCSEPIDYFEGEEEARLGDPYYQFVLAFGEDNDDRNGIGYFQNEAIVVHYHNNMVSVLDLIFTQTDEKERSIDETTSLID